MSIAIKSRGVANQYAIWNGDELIAKVELNDELTSEQQKIVMSRFAEAEAMLEQLYIALPYIEEALNDPAYKRESVNAVLTRMKTVITARRARHDRPYPY